jgi:hypothetical protein
MQKCILINVLRQMHEGAIPNTYACGSVQIDFPLITAGLAEHVLDVGLLNRSVLQSDHSSMSLDLPRQNCSTQVSQSLVRRSKNIRQIQEDPTHKK